MVAVRNRQSSATFSGHEIRSGGSAHPTITLARSAVRGCPLGLWRLSDINPDAQRVPPAGDAQRRPRRRPTPSPAPTATPSPAPTSAPIGELTVSSVGINVPIDGSCGDQLTYVPVGSQVCYWDVTAGGGGFYSFAGSSTSALSTLSRVAAGAIVTWTVAGKSFTRKLSGKSQTFPLDTGHDVPSGQPAYLQIRTATTVVEYDAEK